MGSPRVIVISGPSGAGKTTICHELLKRKNNIKFSVSYTTRAPRSGEKEGVDYFFISEEEFKRKIKEGFFAEWAKVHNHYYGTSKKFIEDTLKSGYHCLLDIDVQGGLQIKKSFPDGIFIFIAPPSIEELKKRLLKRGTEKPEDMEIRLRNALKEMEFQKFYDYVIKNIDLNESVEKILDIIEKNY